jgi:hypothetical protein
VSFGIPDGSSGDTHFETETKVMHSQSAQRKFHERAVADHGGDWDVYAFLLLLADSFPFAR